jgi:hypothetical protein
MNLTARNLFCKVDHEGKARASKGPAREKLNVAIENRPHAVGKVPCPNARALLVAAVE